MNRFRSELPDAASFFRFMAGSAGASASINSKRTVKDMEGPSEDSTSW